jgi:hypothetical protein
MPNQVKPLDPYRTKLVVKHNGTKVGEIPAMAPNAEAYMTELARFYGNIEVEYIEDRNAGLMAMLHNPR